MDLFKNKEMKKIFQLFLGLGLIIVGIAFVLTWWPFVVGLFKGAIGIGLSLLGLLVLFFIKG